MSGRTEHTSSGPSAAVGDDLDQAEQRCRERLAGRPHDPEVLHILGMILLRRGRTAEALDLLREAVNSDPCNPQCLLNLGSLLGQFGRHDEAATRFREALSLNPHYPAAWQNLGVSLERLGRTSEAADAYAQVIALQPGSASGYYLRANTLRRLARPREAMGLYRRAIELQPDHAEALRNLASTLGELGRYKEAAQTARRAAELRPDESTLGSDYLHLLHFDPDCSPAMLYEAAVGWAARHEQPLRPPAPEFPHDRSADRVLRVGYVSGDFRHHPVGRFIAPVLAHHDRKQVEVYCYSHVREPDDWTARLQSTVYVWRDTRGLDCAALAELVRRDRMDVLLDLTGHLADDRLLAFARRPAPVQVTYLGYPDTTGMRSIGYRITDAIHDPPGETERWHTERLVRLPRCCWCYDPGELPPVNDLPAASSSNVTFACMSQLIKVTPAIIRLWGRILERVPRSRLLVLVEPGYVNDAEIPGRFADGGIDRTRLVILPRRSRQEYLKLFQKVDVCLDTLPFNGHTTTLDALWMGVPTVSFAGCTHVQRAGLSVLTAVGLEHLVARSGDAYSYIAVKLASDLSKLAELRRTLRERTRVSPLADGRGLAAALETAYRSMWHEWCASGSFQPVPSS